MIRIGILIVILVLVGGAMYNDIVNKQPAVEKAVDKMFALVDQPSDDPKGITSERVQKELGFKPSRTFKVGNFDVEEYKFTRTVPFLKFRSTYAVYDGGALHTVVDQVEPTLEKLKGVGKQSFEQKAPVSGLPTPGLAGGAPADSGETKEEKKEEKKDAEGTEPKKDDDSNTKDGDGAEAKQPAEGDQKTEEKTDESGEGKKDGTGEGGAPEDTGNKDGGEKKDG